MLDTVALLAPGSAFALGFGRREPLLELLLPVALEFRLTSYLLIIGVKRRGRPDGLVEQRGVPLADPGKMGRLQPNLRQIPTALFFAWNLQLGQTFDDVFHILHREIRPVP